MRVCGTSSRRTVAPELGHVGGGHVGVITAADVQPAWRAAYLAGLKKFDPGLVADEDRAITCATNICLDIAQGKDKITVVGNAVSRLSGGTVTIAEAQAAQAVELARTNICGRPSPCWLGQPDGDR